MTTDSEIRKLCEEVRLGESWLRAEADKRWQLAKARRSSANTMRNATEDELKAAKRMAETVAGRKLDLVSTSVDKAKAGADIDERIADKYESESELLVRLAGYLFLLREKLEAERKLLSAMRTSTTALRYFSAMVRDKRKREELVEIVSRNDELLRPLPSSPEVQA